MNSCKLTFILLTILIYLLYQRCILEGLDNEETDEIKHTNSCKDDANWFVEDKEGNKHYCSDIGSSASCYDVDKSGREGWERCVNTCGNCVNTKVTKLPQNILAGFSGDPIDDFGVVLNVDTEREFVGNQDRLTNQDQQEDINNIMDRLSATEDIFDLITGNIVDCVVPSGQPSPGQFKGCHNTFLSCPTPGIPTPTSSKNYIKQESDGTISFPARQFRCSAIPTSIRGRPNECKKYYLFDKIIDRSSNSSNDINTSSIAEIRDRNLVTLHDVCPLQCGVTECSGAESPATTQSNTQSNTQSELSFGDRFANLLHLNL